MGKYWSHEGPQQAAYDRLHGELVPRSGPCETLEGELLRAAGKIGYEFYNNAEINNISGCLYFLREYLPGFKEAWWDTLAPHITGRGYAPRENGYQCCEEIVDATVSHVLSRNGHYQPNPEDMHDLRVEATGLEPEWEEAEEEEEEEKMDYGT